MQKTANNSSDSTVTSRTTNNKNAIPPRSTLELLIDAAGAVSGGPPGMAPTRAELPPLRLAARSTTTAAASSLAPSPNMLYATQRLPPIQAALHPLAHPNSLLPRPNPTSPPHQLSLHSANLNAKPEAVLQHHPAALASQTATGPKKACPILPRGPTALPCASSMTLVSTPIVCNASPAGASSPASSTTSLAAVAAVATATLSDVEKRQMIRKVRNREAAARSNLRRKEKHLALKHELNEAHEQAQRLRKVEESLKEENEQLRHLLGRTEKCNQVSSVLKARCARVDETP